MDMLLQFQTDIQDNLNSEAYFSTISVAKLRDLVITQDIAARLPHLTAKGGKFGCGVLVNMPEIRAVDANISPPQSELICTLDVVENPELNFNPATGTTLTCEEVARQARAILEPLAIEMPTGWQNFRADQGAIVIGPIPDIRALFPGCAGYRLTLVFPLGEAYQPKCATPLIAENSPLQITLTCATAGASIYYTTDGTFPGPISSAYGSTTPGANAGTAQIYSAPFGVQAGTFVRCKAFAPGCLGSDVPGETINS